MKYSEQERLEIGRKIYTREITYADASEQYKVSWYTARAYMREYRDLNNLPTMPRLKNPNSKPKTRKPIPYDQLLDMTKEDLIDEVIRARIETERTKKGYTAKGGGQEKEFSSLNNMNSK